MFRVLHLMGCADAGGISMVVLNYYRFIDRSKVHFDIALTVDTVGQNAQALMDLGAQVFFVPMKSMGLGAFRRALTKILKEGKYDAIHVHESETCYVALSVAKKLGVPCRVAHAHTSSPCGDLKSELRRQSGCLLNYHYATQVIGCGKLAGDRVFGKRNMQRPKAMVLPNAIDTERFSFNQRVRKEVREELGLEGKYVIGMVGRLSEQKNIPYALELMTEVRKQIPNAVLVVAGNGPDEAKINDRIQELHLEDVVAMLGRRADVARLYQAFDIFIMPSFFEGYPLAAVEALASGLPVLLADTITRELEFASALRYIPLSEQSRWIAEIVNWQEDEDRAERQKEVTANGLDIHDTVKLLERTYIGASNNNTVGVK
ncbi:MAG: glycosyltransferase [Oscillospiraceae bacterium]|nr:glycosyltransferase [Oscillospiraceae bacterium]